MQMYKKPNVKINLEFFLWSVLAFFLLLVLLGLIHSTLDKKFLFFSYVTGFFDDLFRVLSIFNPITHYIGIEFKPIFGGAENELRNKNPIIMRILSNAALTTLFISITAMVGGFVIANIVAVLLILPDSTFHYRLNFHFFIRKFNT